MSHKAAPLTERLDRLVDPFNQGGGDAVLTELAIANVARAIADGQLLPRWALGAAIGRLLTAERQG